jgi:hypothetical protein
MGSFIATWRRAGCDVFDLEAHRTYAREYERARRAGSTPEECRARARAAVDDPESAARRGGARTKYHAPGERLAARRRSRLKAYAREKQELAAAAAGRAAAGMTDHAPRVRASPEALREAERIRNMYHPTIVGELMGDPLPGRSALDKRR